MVSCSAITRSNGPTQLELAGFGLDVQPVFEYPARSYMLLHLQSIQLTMFDHGYLAEKSEISLSLILKHIWWGGGRG